MYKQIKWSFSMSTITTLYFKIKSFDSFLSTYVYHHYYYFNLKLNLHIFIKIERSISIFLFKFKDYIVYHYLNLKVNLTRVNGREGQVVELMIHQALINILGSYPALACACAR